MLRSQSRSSGRCLFRATVGNVPKPGNECVEPTKGSTTRWESLRGRKTTHPRSRHFSLTLLVAIAKDDKSSLSLPSTRRLSYYYFSCASSALPSSPRIRTQVQKR